MALAFTLLFLTLHLAAMRNEIMRRRVRTMLLMQADARRALTMDLGPHAAFIVSAYAVAAADRRRADRLGRCSTTGAQTRMLADLEAQRRDAPLGARERSARH